MGDTRDKNVLFGPEPGKESRKKYGIAFNRAREEFAQKGITHPTGKTPGFRERVQEIYKDLMGDSYKPMLYSDLIKKELLKEIVPQIVYTPEEIQNSILQMEKESAIKSLPGKTYGGYAFSLAQMETVKGLPEEKLKMIGETMVKAIAAKKRKYQIKQDLFRAVINWDTEFFVELAFADCFFLEKPLILSFYHEFEYEDEEEARRVIDESEYLKHYPELKTEVLKDALWIARGRAD